LVVSGNRKAFGGKKVEHVLILASGEKVRHVTIRPWMTAAAAIFLAVFTLGYLAATGYLVLRDDLINATLARQNRMQRDYEDRISVLRAQLDRVTSRQMMDQQLIDQKVQKLLEQQNALFSRHGKLGDLFDRAAEVGLTTPPVSVKPPKDEREASLGEASDAILALLGKDETTLPDNVPTLAYAPLREGRSERADRMFADMSQSLQLLEQNQLASIEALTVDASETASQIARIMKRTGIDVDALVNDGDTGLGGPFVEPEPLSDPFDTSIEELDAALNRLETLRGTALALPYGNPAPGKSITSRYGNRIDPFLGQLAFHAGIDFQASTGAKVVSTGAGTVIAAEYSGGYGNLVEIDHGHGITTRFGHLSKLLVKKGDRVSAGDVIGRAGTTGRSTGPHVHYEVRRNGQAVDPVHFLNAGMKLTSYLN